jgi:hypothetical protein
MRSRRESGYSPQEIELWADCIGAEYAIRAGFDLSAHLRWIFSRPDGGSTHHGSMHARALTLSHYIRVPITNMRRPIAQGW